MTEKEVPHGQRIIADNYLKAYTLDSRWTCWLEYVGKSWILKCLFRVNTKNALINITYIQWVQTTHMSLRNARLMKTQLVCLKIGRVSMIGYISMTRARSVQSNVLVLTPKSYCVQKIPTVCRIITSKAANNADFQTLPSDF